MNGYAEAQGRNDKTRTSMSVCVCTMVTRVQWTKVAMCTHTHPGTKKHK